jgi:hypothetical protein
MAVGVWGLQIDGSGPHGLHCRRLALLIDVMSVTDALHWFQNPHASTHQRGVRRCHRTSPRSIAAAIHR